METENSKMTDMIINLLIVFGVYIIVAEIIMPLFFNKRTGGGCGGGDGRIADEFLKESEVSSRDKACVAVELCGTVSASTGKYVSKADVSKWKHQILTNAEKIFGKEKPASKKETPSKKRRR